MTTAIAAIDAILFVLLAYWAITLRQKEKGLDKIRGELKQHTEALIEKQETAQKVWCFYRFSESDYNKPESKMLRDAKERVTASIGRRIVKNVGIDEIVENGTLIGYKVEIEVKKAPSNVN